MSEGIFNTSQPIEIPPLQADDRVGGHLGVITDFVSAVRTRREPETAGSDNIKSLAMVFAAVESANTGKLVEIRI